MHDESETASCGLTTEALMIAARDAGIALYVRKQAARSQDTFCATNDTV